MRGSHTITATRAEALTCKSSYNGGAIMHSGELQLSVDSAIDLKGPWTLSEAVYTVLKTTKAERSRQVSFCFASAAQR